MQRIFLAALTAFLLASTGRAQLAGPAVEQVMTSVEIASASTGFSKPFYLKYSENFSVEIDVESGTPNYDLILQYRGSDKAWHDDPEGDVVTAETATWAIHAMTADYNVLQFRIKITNDDGSAATYSVWVHQDNENQIGR